MIPDQTNRKHSLQFVVTRAESGWYLIAQKRSFGPLSRKEALALAMTKAVKAAETGAAADVLVENVDGAFSTLFQARPRLGAAASTAPTQ